MRRIVLLSASLAALTCLVACGDDPDASANVDDRPSAIVSLSPTATEMLFAIGAGEQIIAVDEYSNHPAAALEKPNDLSGFEPNVEAIAALEPDLVVMMDDRIAAQLEDLGIAVWVGPAAASFDDVYRQITELGAATGRESEAADLVAQMKADIDDAVASASGAAAGLSYYHELDPTLYSVTSATFAGQVYALFGLVNIADGAQEGNDYPQLNPEYIVQADPDLIFLADTKCCGETAASLASRDGWGDIAAVTSGGVIELDDDIASRWGPRIVDFVREVAAAVTASGA